MRSMQADSTGAAAERLRSDTIVAERQRDAEKSKRRVLYQSVELLSAVGRAENSPIDW
jgi:hypothetical protein